jgi:putative polyhydroxyalkanoate system protein
MSQINIVRKHQIPLSELKLKIDHVMTEINQKLDFRTEWESENEFSFRRKGASGTIHVASEQLELNLNLGLMYRALKGVVESRIVEALNKHIG